MTPTYPVAGLIWDMDGTLIDSATVVPDAFIATVAALEGASFTRDEVIALYPLGPPAAMLARMLDRPAVTSDLDRYHEGLAQRAHAVSAYPGIHDALETLSSSPRELAMAVFTGASSRAAELLLQAADLARYFDVIVGGDEVPHPKPHPAGIHVACRRLSLETTVCAYIGDAPSDIEAARRSGALPLAASWGHLHKTPESADGIVVVGTPTDLPRVLNITQ